MTTLERLAQFAETNGINWDRAAIRMIDGDVEACAAQLRHAREANSPADREAVLWWLREMAA